MNLGSMLYVHIPFCLQKCKYCDFLSYSASSEERQIYIDALCREIKAWSGKEQHPITSLFIGGGTPSLLTLNQIDQLMSSLHESFIIPKEVEQTIEVNPGTVTREKAQCWQQMGINRVSMGVQSMDDAILKRLGRIHDRKQVFESWKFLIQAGFENLSFDLMMGLPDQSLQVWEKTLHEAIRFAPKHLSCYSLIIEEGTPFYYEVDQLNLPDETVERSMYQRTQEMLSEAGFYQYEISNFACPGYESRHNMGYWQRIPYIGLGLGASSLLKEEIRYHNTNDMKYYLQHSMDPEQLQEEFSVLNSKDQMEEFMFLGLRCTQGIEIKRFQDLFGLSIWSVYGSILEKHTRNGLLEIQNGWVHLTAKGLDLANQVFADFLLDK